MAEQEGKARSSGKELLMPLWLNTLVICRLPCLPGASALHFRFSTWAWSRAFLPAELPERGQGGRELPTLALISFQLGGRKWSGRKGGGGGG